MEQATSSNPFSLAEKPQTVRYIGRHKKCGFVKAVDVLRKPTSVSVGSMEGGKMVSKMVTAQLAFAPKSERCQCGKGMVRWTRVIGKISEKHKCDARCLNAIGPNCDCSCGGANHGAGWL